MIATEEDELLSAMAGAPTEIEAAMDSEDSTLRRRALTDAKIQVMGGQIQPRAESVSSVGKSPVPIPSESADMPRRSRDGGFDWARALTAFGDGDVGALDARRRYADEAPSREMETRKRQQLIEDEQQRRQSARNLIDPNSQESLSAQQDMSRYLNSMAEAPGIGTLASEFRRQAAATQGKSASEIARMKLSFDSYFGNMMKLRESSRKSDHDSEMADLRREGLGASQANAAAMRDLAGARFTESKEENQRRQDDREAQRSEKEAEAYGKDISPLNENESLLGGVELLKGNVNTGKLAAPLQKARQSIGLKDDNWDTLEGRLSAVSNQIIKLQAGGNVTAGEAARMQQQLPDMTKDDDEFNAKLATVMEQIRLKKEQVRQKHPKTSGVAPPQKSKPAPHGQRVRQNGKWFSWDGERYVTE